MRAVAWLLPVLALGLGACGGMSDRERFELRTPGVDDTIVREVAGSEKVRTGDPTKAELRVIRAWAKALTAGRVVEAAQLFDVPSVVADGVHLQRRLGSRQAVLDFNNSLACGQKLLETQRGNASVVIADFELTERPGSGECGAHVSEKAINTFVVEGGRIQRWESAGTPLRGGKSRRGDSNP
jgi:hypothetical protein